MSHVTEIQELFLHTWADMCTPASKDPIKSDYVGFFLRNLPGKIQVTWLRVSAAAMAAFASICFPPLQVFFFFWQNYTRESLKDELMPRFEAGIKGSEGREGQHTLLI